VNLLKQELPAAEPDSESDFSVSTQSGTEIIPTPMPESESDFEMVPSRRDIKGKNAEKRSILATSAAEQFDALREFEARVPLGQRIEIAQQLLGDIPADGETQLTVEQLEALREFEARVPLTERIQISQRLLWDI
jgi:hypothetical protein